VWFEFANPPPPFPARVGASCTDCCLFRLRGNEFTDPRMRLHSRKPIGHPNSGREKNKLSIWNRSIYRTACYRLSASVRLNVSDEKVGIRKYPKIDLFIRTLAFIKCFLVVWKIVERTLEIAKLESNFRLSTSIKVDSFSRLSLNFTFDCSYLSFPLRSYYF